MIGLIEVRWMNKNISILQGDIKGKILLSHILKILIYFLP